jgi:hypothetical protein
MRPSETYFLLFAYTNGIKIQQHTLDFPSYFLQFALTLSLTLSLIPLVVVQCHAMLYSQHLISTLQSRVSINFIFNFFPLLHIFSIVRLTENIHARKYLISRLLSTAYALNFSEPQQEIRFFFILFFCLLISLLSMLSTHSE